MKLCGLLRFVRAIGFVETHQDLDPASTLGARITEANRCFTRAALDPHGETYWRPRHSMVSSQRFRQTTACCLVLSEVKDALR